MTAPPREAMGLLTERFGSPVTADLLSDRRGSRTWKVVTPAVPLAVKANVPGQDRARDKAAELEQEDQHLLHLTKVSAVEPSYRVDAGPWEGGQWLAVRWLDGVPLWHALALARGPEGNRPSVRPWLLAIARSWAQRLAGLHAAGWAHADVQPTNTLVDAETVHLIDYALACGPAEGRRVPYRGALTHTTAPEVADAVLSTSADTHIQARPEADVWGLGASLFWCWTGQRPVAYEDTVDRMAKLQAIARGRTVPLDNVRPWAFPAFERIITACMATAPDQRPSTAQVAAGLTEADQ
ncbi:protein kinase [Streptomyces sp. XD-27]|uniref:protein kinase domain-containing protein n=1 Tax=Streptomyces sp. XD-27 TaxID=3062779 RepID=UPI0026F449AA|nr:protein kinase [Streptomyces sp. XD-27]WKX70921.1 protein kinase [Streptomyces sp. XD-27]